MGGNDDSRLYVWLVVAVRVKVCFQDQESVKIRGTLPHNKIRKALIGQAILIWRDAVEAG